MLLDTIYDRNEQEPGTPADPTGNPIPPVVSPAPPKPDDPELEGIIPFTLCYETNVIAFGEDGGDILGSSNLHTINNGTELFSSDHGWARFELDDYAWDEDESGIIEADEEALSRDPLGDLHGLPVTGFAVQRFENNFLGDGADTLANYGGIFQHKATRSMGSY